MNSSPSDRSVTSGAVAIWACRMEMVNWLTQSWVNAQRNRLTEEQDEEGWTGTQEASIGNREYMTDEV